MFQDRDFWHGLVMELGQRVLKERFCTECQEKLSCLSWERITQEALAHLIGICEIEKDLFEWVPNNHSVNEWSKLVWRIWHHWEWIVEQCLLLEIFQDLNLCAGLCEHCRENKNKIKIRSSMLMDV